MCSFAIRRKLISVGNTPTEMKYLGQMIGFPAASADIRISQYENDSRIPKPELIRKLADILGVAPEYWPTPVPSTLEEMQVMEFWQQELSNHS